MSTARYICISRSGETLLHASEADSKNGTLYYLSPAERAALSVELLDEYTPREKIEPAGGYEQDITILYCEDDALNRVAEELREQGATLEPSSSGFRFYPGTTDPVGRAHYAKALAARDYRIEMGYSAYSGDAVPLNSKGIRVSEAGEMVFPRIEPAVMALVTNLDNTRVLLANNRQWHSNRYALIAGFVDPGENLEHAAIREVYEELGQQAERVEYRMSDVWPFPRSLMVCFQVFADETQELTYPDGEIANARWFDAAQLRAALAEEPVDAGASGEVSKLELPGTNAVARRMLEWWLQTQN
ncbi:MAG: NAD(+) diphosphatase [Rothia sp. (in: high G+C Gram-positive bacteria)]|uniref:NUDIX domain-containing protein n=1 Tax=Rothia sp. (in: high G+C Gram-positive bacteria) TaxID=1885016 RepID=UPI0026E042C6|nr:NAD(+) diphosphatase [Rothia sp. (in: high G+C Gram-positive bacteria)]MDO5750075.1 NAD(+) diphosphatase [Rothia sp. (in: high G+C Gram-positive bacteria)]